MPVHVVVQIETLLNENIAQTKELLSKPNASGKVSISLSKLTKTQKDSSVIPIIKTVSSAPYTIQELENGTIEVINGGELVTPVRPLLQQIAAKLNVSIVNGNGNPYNTRQLGSLLIKVISQNSKIS